MSRDKIQHYCEPYMASDTASAEDTSVAAVSTGVKWGAATFGTAGGTVTWSIASSYVAGRAYYDSSMSLLPSGYLSEIQQAFNAWEAVANIHFQQVSDGAGVDIRIGGSTIDGAYSVLGLAHWTSSGTQLTTADIELDVDENWTLDASGISI